MAQQKAHPGGMSGPSKKCYQSFASPTVTPREDETGLLRREGSRKEYGKFDGGPPSIIWFKRCFHDKSDDEVCERTKNAANIWANSWYVGVALNMTLGVALLNNFDPGSVTQRTEIQDWQFELARFSYLFLVLHGTVFATLGVITSAYTVIDTASVPAIAYPEYYAVLCEEFKASNVSFLGWTLGSAGTAKFWAMLSFVFLMTSAVPFCFLMYGRYGLLIGVEGLVVFLALLRWIESRRRRVNKGIDRISFSSLNASESYGTMQGDDQAAAFSALTSEKQYEAV
eukprot:Tamp_25880.p1 GENE.Tamp_25880~~Tamp_25880.p1  ORF type:complete len:292 (-),score=52.75 Tamp_25880:46-897(-)